MLTETLTLIMKLKLILPLTLTLKLRLNKKNLHWWYISSHRCSGKKEIYGSHL